MLWLALCNGLTAFIISLFPLLCVFTPNRIVHPVYQLLSIVFIACYTALIFLIAAKTVKPQSVIRA